MTKLSRLHGRARWRFVWVAALASAAWAPTANAATELVVVVEPGVVSQGQLATIEVRSFDASRRTSGACCDRRPGGLEVRSLTLRIAPPSGGATTITAKRVRAYVWRATYRARTVGSWTVTYVRNGRPVRDDFNRIARTSFRMIEAPSRPPSAFGGIGRSPCAPPSPRAVTKSAPMPEVFGTATGGQLWGLFMFSGGARWADNEPATATLESAAGKELKIVIRAPGSYLAVSARHAIGGATVAPVWGPRAHAGSDWERPGNEWGIGLTLPSAGCWEIRASTGTVRGAFWVRVNS